jgi:cbb3-type cytochrome oxidase maturation protein
VAVRAGDGGEFGAGGAECPEAEEEGLMEALYLLIPLSVILVAFAVWIFFGAAESGQFEDLDGPALRILSDDDD